MTTKFTTTKYRQDLPLPDQSTLHVYGLTENGRDILTDGRFFWVQPKYDNYWLCARTANAALDAFYSRRAFSISRRQQRRAT